MAGQKGFLCGYYKLKRHHVQAIYAYFSGLYTKSVAMIYDAIVVGGGIVGLATALNLVQKQPGIKLLVIEKEKQLAAHQTGHNSGVIHSGLYYKPGSLKAKNCIEGYHRLVQFCQEEGIPFELCGKIVVATTKAQLPTLEMLYNRGRQNGLDGLKWLNSQDELQAYEPHVAGLKGIFVPQTGIIDYTQVCLKYAEKIQAAGGTIHLGEAVTGIHDKQTVQVVTTKSSYQGKHLVNCGGLWSDKLAQHTVSPLNVKIIPFRGEYYQLKKEKQHLVKNLIYPVPDPNFPFLGVHFTRMVNGGVEAGPNAVLAYRREGYTKKDVHLGQLFESLTWPGFRKVAAKYWRTGMGELYRSYSKAAFTKALQGLIPEITTNDLVTGGAGVRAQACDRTGGLVDDFLIYDSPKVIHVCNAPSPAATSSLAIGHTVANMLLSPG